MGNLRRTAVVTAAVLLCATAPALPEPSHRLPVGTVVVFVSPVAIAAGRRDGSVTGVTLRDPLVLEGEVLAPSGTRADLYAATTILPDGRHATVFSLEHFTIKPGLLPVRLAEPLTVPLAAGAVVEARTLAEVERVGDRLSIRIPFPFRLGGDRPASAYTPTPARTMNSHPLDRPRGGTAQPAPRPSAGPSVPANSTKIPG